VTDSCTQYPLAAVRGHNIARRALMLAAIDPGLKGVLIASNSEMAGLLARSLGLLITGAGPLVEMPLNVTEDRLIGGLDVDGVLATGARRLRPGLLAEANGGLIYSNLVNLLPARSLDIIGAALDSRAVRVEREGLSRVCPAGFLFAGSYDPAEGLPPRSFVDRIGLLAELDTDAEIDDRVDALSRFDAFAIDPIGFSAPYAALSAALLAAISQASRRLRHVCVEREAVARLASAALALGVEGNRADLFAMKAARASAALCGRDSIDDVDIEIAIRLVLAPRASDAPPQQRIAPPVPERHGQEPRPQGQADGESTKPTDDLPGPWDEVIVPSIETPLPDPLQLTPYIPVSRSSPGGRQFNTSAGRRSHLMDAARGRHYRSTPADGSHGALDWAATLRAAAPHQKARRQSRKRGLASGALIERRSQSIGTRSAKHPRRPILKPADIQLKRFSRRAGILFIFAVDSSGSVGLSRMAQAKGAVIRLLQEAYQHRDRVSLIAFRGEAAEVLLPPTRSVDLARRCIETLPAGGGTPLASGLLRAREQALAARSKLPGQVMLIVFTDGRANVGAASVSGLDQPARRRVIADELKQIGVALGEDRIVTVVVDTSPEFLSRAPGGGRLAADELARLIGARYMSLPRADSESIYNTIKGVVSEGRSI
jgi:magnesium chelatase subunit D